VELAFAEHLPAEEVAQTFGLCAAAVANTAAEVATRIGRELGPEARAAVIELCKQTAEGAVEHKITIEED
jgi:hypothetical protein